MKIDLRTSTVSKMISTKRYKNLQNLLLFDLLGEPRGCPGGILGCPGASQGSSWGVLGRSWAVLGRSWGDIFTRPTSERFLITFLIDFGRQKGAKREAFWEPRWVKKRSKNGVENEDEKKTLLGGSWVDFGTFWTLSWGQKSSKSISGASIS